MFSISSFCTGHLSHATALAYGILMDRLYYFNYLNYFILFVSLSESNLLGYIIISWREYEERSVGGNVDTCIMSHNYVLGHIFAPRAYITIPHYFTFSIGSPVDRQSNLNASQKI